MLVSWLASTAQSTLLGWFLCRAALRRGSQHDLPFNCTPYQCTRGGWGGWGTPSGRYMICMRGMCPGDLDEHIVWELVSGFQHTNPETPS